jgi:hypothetical protein
MASGSRFFASASAKESEPGKFPFREFNTPVPGIKLDSHFPAISCLKTGIQPVRLQTEQRNRKIEKERAMRKWYVPLTVLGIGSVSAFLLSERGRNALSDLAERFRGTPDRLLQWNETTLAELDRIQTALNEIAESLQPQQPHIQAGR